MNTLLCLVYERMLQTFRAIVCFHLHSLTSSKKRLTAKDIEDNFDGNICRCTGYRPILDAFKSMASDASEELRRKVTDMEVFMILSLNLLCVVYCSTNISTFTVR